MTSFDLVDPLLLAVLVLALVAPRWHPILLLLVEHHSILFRLWCNAFCIGKFLPFRERLRLGQRFLARQCGGGSRRKFGKYAVDVDVCWKAENLVEEQLNAIASRRSKGLFRIFTAKG